MVVLGSMTILNHHPHYDNEVDISMNLKGIQILQESRLNETRVEIILVDWFRLTFCHIDCYYFLLVETKVNLTCE